MFYFLFLRYNLNTFYLNKLNRTLIVLNETQNLLRSHPTEGCDHCALPRQVTWGISTDTYCFKHSNCIDVPIITMSDVPAGIKALPFGKPGSIAISQPGKEDFVSF